jgi:hypothetical protein
MRRVLAMLLPGAEAGGATAATLTLAPTRMPAAWNLRAAAVDEVATVGPDPEDEWYWITGASNQAEFNQSIEVVDPQSFVFTGSLVGSAGSGGSYAEVTVSLSASDGGPIVDDPQVDDDASNDLLHASSGDLVPGTGNLRIWVRGGYGFEDASGTGAQVQNYDVTLSFD